LVTLTIVDQSATLYWIFCHRSSIYKVPHLRKTETTA